MATHSPEEMDAFIRLNHTSHDSRVGLVLAIDIPLVVLMVGVLCLRFYARTIIKRTLGKDDWVMALSAVGSQCRLSSCFSSLRH